MNLDDILQRHDKEITAVVAAFQEELESIVVAAQAKLQAWLHTVLKLNPDGTIARTRKNSVALRKLDDWFMEEMAATGFVHLSREFVNRFPGQLPFFDQIVEWLAAQTKTPLKVSWTVADKAAFTDFANGSQVSIEALVSSIAATAKNQVLLTFGGLKYSDLLATLARKLNTIPEKVTSLADTSIVSFYRTIADAGYRKLQFYFPEQGLRYKYAGPPSSDKLIRPFCQRLMAETEADRSWAREEIDRMNNGQLPNVWLSCGGWNCRHQFVLAIPSAQARA